MGDSYLGGSINTNSIALNRQDGAGAQKPNTGAGGSCSHEYKPAKSGDGKVPMPK